MNDNGTIKDIAIKILRPDIKKIFNEEIDALMLLAFIIEGTVKKTKRLKLVEVSHKLGISVTDFKKIVSRIQKGEKESRIANRILRRTRDYEIGRAHV